MKSSLKTIRGVTRASMVLYSGFLAIAAAANDGETITIGDHVFEIDTDGNVAAGRHEIDVSGGSTVAASRVLTTTGNAVADETVTIGSTVYTWKASAAAAFQVAIGGTASESLDNLVAAINLATGAGTKYGTGTTVHPSVTASKTSASTVTVTAKVPGTPGNAIASTETMTNASWAGATLTGGVSPTAAEVIAAITTAINGSRHITNLAADAVAAGVVVQGTSFRGPYALTETLAGSGNAWDKNAMTGLDTGGETPNVSFMVQRVVTADENTANRMTFGFDQPLAAFDVSVRSSAGQRKAWDGKITQEGLSILLTDDGAVNLATGDVVTLHGAV